MGPHLSHAAVNPLRRHISRKGGPRRSYRWFGRWVLGSVLLLFITAGVGMATGWGTYKMYALTVPEFTSVDDYIPKIGTRIYSADHRVIGEFAEERRILVPYADIPPLLFKAFIAAEDKRFFEHTGVDFWGLLHAVVDKIRHPDDKLRGASTITQQVAKSLLATHESYAAATERTLVRKLREAILARRLEQHLTKEEILSIYLNQIFLGHKAYGVQAAAEHYFRKNLGELSLAEMATLAGLPQRPSDYSPYTRPQAAKNRRQYVLRRMLEDGHITQAQFDVARDVDLTVYPREELYLEIAPYYTEQVRRELVEMFGEQTVLEEGLQVHTAADIEWQAYAQHAVEEGLRALDKRQGYRGALAHLDSDALHAAFIRAYRNTLDLQGNAEPTLDRSQPYLALVEKIDDTGAYARINIAGMRGALPLAGMRWARQPEPTERVDYHFVTDIRHVLTRGDVIWVQLTSARALQEDPYGGPIASANLQRIADGEKPGTPLFRLEQDPAPQSALMSVDPFSGYVLAEVGGYDFAASVYNRALQACREPGSAFKPVVYSAAIAKLGYTASTLIDDKPLVFDDPDNQVRWKPTNAGEEFRGRLPLRICLQDSINTPAIRVAEAVGIEDVIKNAQQMGITTPLKRELGTALGSSCTTLENVMNVYVTLNQYGVRRPLKMIRRIIDRHGAILVDESVPWDADLDLRSQLDRAYSLMTTPEVRALDAQTAFITTSLLKNVILYGTGSAANQLGQVIAGKTGTTNDNMDAWFMGFTRQVVTGVWVGHDDKLRPLGVGEQGGRTALPIWLSFMTRALQDHTKQPSRIIPQGDFEPPEGVIAVEIDPYSGMLARPNATRKVTEYYKEGTEPTEFTPDGSVVNPEQIDVFGADAPL